MDKPTRLPMLNQAQLSLKDYSLLSDLTKVLTDCSASLSVEDVLVLFARLNVQVDASILASVFEQADGTREGRLPSQVFAQAFCYEVQSLSAKSVQLIAATESLHIEIEDLKARLRTVQRSSATESGVLTVHLGRLVGLNPARTCSFVVICERQRRVTRELQSNFPDGWGENLSFHVTSGTGDILFSLVSGADVLAQCAVPIPSLRDQQKHEAWVDLSRPSVKVQLALQWLHSPELRARGELTKQEAALSKAISDLESTERRLRALGMRGKEDWSTVWLRKAQVAAEGLRQSSCATECSLC